MPNPQKIDLVEGLSEKLKRATGIYVTDYLGLTVEDITELRRKLFENEIEYTVVKNTLAKISARNANLANIDDMLTGPTALALTYDDPTSPARVIKEFKQERDLPEVKGFIFEGKVMDQASFNSIANLPSRDQLLTQLIVGLSSPLTKIVFALKNSLSNVVHILNNLKETKQS
ncbi:MAG: 50S ribosomal protein L10 [Fidelibacterota bacterium]